MAQDPAQTVKVPPNHGGITVQKPSPMASGGRLFSEGGALSFRIRGFLRRSRHFLGLQRTFRLGSEAVSRRAG